MKEAVTFIKLIPDITELINYLILEILLEQMIF